jgi:hypothetical protein
MKIQQIWASLLGAVSATIGILRFIPATKLNITPSDGVIHIITGIIFIAGAWMKNGKYVNISNLVLGVFYTIWGIASGPEWPHVITGAITIGLSALFVRKARQ